MYNLIYTYNPENRTQYGYILTEDNVILKEIYFDKDKMAYSDIVRQKIDFLFRRWMRVCI